MQPVKAIALDLDGTLLNGSKDVSPYTRNILSQLHDQGQIIGLCSGRDPRQMEKNLVTWHMDEIASFLIANNGADYVNLKTGDHFRGDYISQEDLNSLEQALENFPVSIGLLSGSRIYWNRRTLRAYLYSLANRKIPVFGQRPGDEDMKWPKAIVTGRSAALQSIFKRAHKLPLKIIPVGTFQLEAVAPTVSKYQALKLAMNDFHFSGSEVLSFGDDYNDLELLRRTQGVAMKNSVDIVKEAAGKTTKYANSQDGVAYHLNSMLMYDDCFWHPGEISIFEPEELPEEEQVASALMDASAYYHAILPENEPDSPPSSLDSPQNPEKTEPASPVCQESQNS